MKPQFKSIINKYNNGETVEWVGKENNSMEIEMLC